MKKISIVSIASLTLFFSWGCKDDFAGLNTDPSVVSKPDIRFLFTKALQDFDPYSYQYWFYQGADYFFNWAQVSGSSDINLNLMGERGGTPLYRVMVSTEEIKHIVNNQYTGEESARHQYIKAMCDPLAIYLAIMATDLDGSMPYSEAVKGRFTSPPLLAPAYDTQQDMFDRWLSELDSSIRILTNPVIFEGREIQQVALGAQDIIYRGDVSKWAKYANSLKLRIAVRLLHRDREKAFTIVREVVNSPAGVLSSVDDDFVYNLGVEQYHFGDDIPYNSAGKPLIDFLVKNKDPRVRFLFTKNSYNSKVVQAYFDARAELPFYIREVVDSEINAEGKEIFTGWKAPGEPWVRYFGRPILLTGNQEPEYLDYFDGNRFRITLNGVERAYAPLSAFNEENVRGQIDLTYPDAPGAPVVQDRQDVAWHAALFTTAEVNLYLAEFALLGASLPQTAETYFREAVRASVTITDRVAGLNRIPYYHDIYDTAFEKSIRLEEGEIEALLGQEAYQLTGDRATRLEKVYLQQYIHFINIPNELFVTVRRSGIPRKESRYIPWESFLKTEAYVIPRRFVINAVEESDLLYDIKMNAYRDQGFTVGNNAPLLLNTERVWYDQGAPDFGEGPNY